MTNNNELPDTFWQDKVKGLWSDYVNAGNDDVLEVIITALDEKYTREQNDGGALEGFPPKSDKPFDDRYISE